MDEKLKCERQNYKTLEDNIQKYLYHTEIKKIFLGQTLTIKAKIIKEKLINTKIKNS